MGMYTGMCVQSFVAVKLIIEKKERKKTKTTQISTNGRSVTYSNTNGNNQAATKKKDIGIWLWT